MPMSSPGWTTHGRLLGLTVGAVARGLVASAFGYRTPFAITGGLFGVPALLCALSMRSQNAWEDEESSVAVTVA